MRSIILNTIGILALLAVAFLLFRNSATPIRSPAAVTQTVTQTTTTATSTPVSVITATSTPQKVVPGKPKPVTIATPPAQTTVSAPVNLPQIVSFDQINTSARAALVNIICTTNSNANFSPISGSGVVISPDGVILTNAHIGQYWLLQNFDGQSNFVSCVIRTGSPAIALYKAKLVYISPTWIQNNKDVLVESDPTGTGEHDYAFLKITSRLDGNPVQTPLAYVHVNTSENTQVDDTMLLASYPAEFFDSLNIIDDLYQTSAIGQVSHVYTFATSTVDLIDIPGTVISQKGASGGAVVNDQDLLTALITTSSDATTTGARDLRAITTAYINRDLLTNEGFSLTNLLNNADTVSINFNQNIAPNLSNILTNAILQPVIPYSQ